MFPNKIFLPNAESLCGHVFGLPNYPALTFSDLECIVDVVNSFK